MSAYFWSIAHPLPSLYQAGVRQDKVEELQMIKAASAARNIWQRRDRKSKKLARSLQTSSGGLRLHLMGFVSRIAATVTTQMHSRVVVYLWLPLFIVIIVKFSC